MHAAELERPDTTLDKKKDLRNCHIIVVGNEKGGAGKTTSSMHLITSLLKLNFKVSSIDLDCRQKSITRYVENRTKLCEEKSLDLPLPKHFVGVESTLPHRDDKEQAETEHFNDIFSQAKDGSDFVVIDTPGSNSFLSRYAHSFADTIITPINDSFIDLDVLAKIEAGTLKIERPTIYSEMVWQQKMARAKRDQSKIDWIVMRNRLSNIDARNKRNMATVLEKLSQRIGFRVSPGFGERVIFRELFLYGLTLLDLQDEVMKKIGISFGISHIAARQELRDFISSLNIQKIDEKIA